MKIIIISILITILTACGGGDSNQNTDSNMSGTWRHTQVHRYHNVETNEYLYTNFIETTLIVTEEIDEINYSSCWEYGTNAHFAIKTDDYFYINNGTTAFTRNKDGSYSTQEETNIQYSWMPATYFNAHTTLSKISNDIVIDKGLLVLTGPVAVTEYNHACLSRQYSNISDRETYDLTVPYDDSYLYIRLDLMSKPEVGPFNYIEYKEGASIFGFDIISPATAFWDTVGSNILNITTANINIIESSNSILSGTYSFIANNNENYSGEFQMELNN